MSVPGARADQCPLQVLLLVLLALLQEERGSVQVAEPTRSKEEIPQPQGTREKGQFQGPGTEKGKFQGPGTEKGKFQGPGWEKGQEGFLQLTKSAEEAGG